MDWRRSSNYFRYFIESFKKNMSEFDIKIWGNKELNKKIFQLLMNILKSKKIYGKPMREDKDLGGYILYNSKKEPYLHSKWAQITDLMRLEIVYTHGGYYFDTTFEILNRCINY